MEENFVGYLLKALDPDTQREVEEHLRAYPESRRRLDLLRTALAPLHEDAGEINPPAGLALRTLGRVAEYCCQDLPRAPVILKPRPEPVSRGWWRRADVLVAASLFLCLSLLIPPLLFHLRQENLIEACQNNLKDYGTALMSYSAAHNQAFPNVADARFKPHNVAGIFMPELVQDRNLPEGKPSIRCPGNGPPASCAWTLGQLQGKSEQEFRALAPRLVTCYAYSLGYRDGDGNIHGPVHEGRVPILADRPPPGEKWIESEENSPNHGGRGQNVLFSDGHVEFHTKRNLGKDDDIFLNREGRVGAGVDAGDIVLGVSEARP